LTATLRAIAGPVSPFRYSAWTATLPVLSKTYQANTPIPHIFIADFLETHVAAEIGEEFQDCSTVAWTHYQHHNENKVGLARRDCFPRALGAVTDELNSPEFVSWLSGLTGIPNLMADPMLEGGGLHQSRRGGFLNIHTDFSHHHYQKHWRRRLNLILYLNETWQEEWGGSIELWDSRMHQCVVKYPPRLNHALIFNTDEASFHGFPEPLQCPEGVSRKSLALYYYTVDESAMMKTRSTNYRARPSDGYGKAAMIWLDKQAVDLYSRAKTRFGFSDRLASKILGLISKRR
jgi:2-oxoglutarate-Fe(II)-dependent oxygenase superfamily protein